VTTSEGSGLRQRTVCLFLAATIAIAVIEPLGARASGVVDWQLVRVRAGAAGAHVEVRLNGTAHMNGDDASLLGTGVGGTAIRNPLIFVSPLTIPPADGTITTTQPAGGLDTRLSTLSPHDFGLTVTTRDTLEPSGSVDLLVFITHGSLQVDASLVVEDGRATWEERSGSGSSDVPFAAPSDGGVAAHADFIDTGLSTPGAAVSEGAAGGFIPGTCEGVCTGAWIAPDEQRGSWTTAGFNALIEGSQLAVGLPLRFTFAGPAGNWSWTAGGVFTQPGAMAAWAPIGDDWTAFRPSGS
jgi:hypothetical protein